MTMPQPTNTTLDDICAEIGYSATNTLVAWFGGDYMRVPAEVSPENPIARAIGISAMRRFVQSWGGERLWIPEAHRFTVEQRNRVIADLLLAKMPEKEIAAAVGLTTRRVQQISRLLSTEGCAYLGKTPVGKKGVEKALAKIPPKKPRKKPKEKGARERRLDRARSAQMVPPPEPDASAELTRAWYAPRTNSKS